MTVVGEASLLRRMDQSGMLLLAVRAFLGGMFIWMGLNKIADPVGFLKSVHLYGVLPESPPLYLNATAVVLPWLEVVAGVALVAGSQIRGAALLILVMLLAFTPAVLFRALEMKAETGMSFFDVKFDCGCGSGPEVIWQKMLKNTGYALLALIALLSRSRRFCAAMWFERRRPAAVYCHLCGYAVRNPVAGLCSTCATPPTLGSGDRGAE